MINPFTLNKIPYEYKKLHYLPRVKGLYFVINDNKITYIGYSKNIRNRFKTHCTKLKRTDNDSFIAYKTYPFHTISEIKDLERHAILIFNPSENIRKDKPNDTDITL